MHPTTPPTSSKAPVAKQPESPKAPAGKPIPKTEAGKPVSAAPAPDPKARRDEAKPSHIAGQEKHPAAQQAVVQKNDAMSGLPGVSATGAQKVDTQTMSDQPSAKLPKT